MCCGQASLCLKAYIRQCDSFFFFCFTNSILVITTVMTSGENGGKHSLAVQADDVYDQLIYMTNRSYTRATLTTS